MDSQNIKTTMEELQKECDAFSGDPALYWAGKMAQYIKSMTHCHPFSISEHIMILDNLREKYDQIIFKRAK